MERAQAAFLSDVGGPSFTAVEQLAENACFVDVHLGVFSQKFVFQALLVHLDMVPVALPILREISESRLNFMRTVEPTR